MSTPKIARELLVLVAASLAISAFVAWMAVYAGGLHYAEAVSPHHLVMHSPFYSFLIYTLLGSCVAVIALPVGARLQRNGSLRVEDRFDSWANGEIDCPREANSAAKTRVAPRPNIGFE